MGRQKLGEVLRERGLISPEDLSKALDEQHQKLVLLGEMLLQRNVVDKESLIAALEAVTKVRYVDCRSATINPELLKIITREVAFRNCVLPLGFEDEKMIAVMAEPQNVRIIDELCFITGRTISPRLGFRSEIVAAIDEAYNRSDKLSRRKPEPVVP